MGLLWDFIQHNQIKEQANRSASIEDRVRHLEQRVAHNELLFAEVIKKLETSLGEDLDRDGSIG